MIAYLIPVRAQRFELYSEQPEEAPAAPPPQAGRLRKWAHDAYIWWHEAVATARMRRGSGRLARLRDEAICRMAVSIEEQRTLWELRTRRAASLQYPSCLTTSEASDALSDVLQRERAHHGRWFVIDLVLFAGSALLALVPGPNVLAYYFGFRMLTHLYSWRGARRAATAVGWEFEPEPALSELMTLVDVRRAERGPRVAAIAERLKLRRLASFFDRAAPPGL
jgi:hypothetical protein